ncbi:Abi family protein [Kocuria marina]|uniref:Abi family protein n=1 Tax=Kocuria marina TaxID=223184 RepID=UPI0022E6332D|nr:Abi family protein [Kocuria marina]
MRTDGGVPERERPPKVFQAYSEQVRLLQSRGMQVADPARAERVLRTTNYYRLSGYWYPYRRRRLDGEGRSNTFLEGTSFDDVMALYEFDARLRAAVLADLGPIELAMRALLGHELGRIDPCAHLEPRLMGPSARVQGSAAEPSQQYRRWLERHAEDVRCSREDFVAHHREHYGSKLPIWAAVEVMDWGSLSAPYRLSPFKVQNVLAGGVGLSSAQLGSWLKSMNMLRNYAAHQGRMYNRVYTLVPKLPRSAHPDFPAGGKDENARCFTQLTVVQYLVRALSVGNARLLPAVLRSFPSVARLDIASMGAPGGWECQPLWSS